MKIITWGLIAVWTVLITFAAVSMLNPPWLQKIARLGRDVESRDYEDYGDGLLRSGKYGPAIAQYQRALQIKPDRTMAMVGLALAWEGIGENAEAEKMLRMALTMPGGEPGVICFHLGELYSKLKRTAEAEDLYRRALKLQFQPEITHRRLGAIYYGAADYPRARDEFEASLIGHQDIASSYRNMLHIELAKYQADSVQCRAIEDLIRNLRTDADMAAYDTTLLRRIQEIDPEISRVYCDLGITYLKLGDLDRAIENVRTALQIWPDNSTASSNLAVLNRLQAQAKVPASNEPPK